MASAIDWYDTQQAQLGDDFLVEVRRTIIAISERPESFPMVFGDARRALVRRFPYAVFFVTQGDLISVIAVLHARQDRTRQLVDRT